MKHWMNAAPQIVKDADLFAYHVQLMDCLVTTVVVDRNGLLVLVRIDPVPGFTAEDAHALNDAIIKEIEPDGEGRLSGVLVDQRACHEAAIERLHAAALKHAEALGVSTAAGF